MRKPRVAFFIDQWRPGTGTENQLQGMLSYLVPDCIDAHLFTLREPLAEEHRKLFRCPVDCLGIGSLVSLNALVKLPVIARQLRRGDFDVAMIFFVDTNLYVVPACRLAGIPAVVINRRDMGYWYETGPLKILNFVNRWATDFLCNALAVKDQVIRYEHFDSGRIAVIPNGVWDPEHRCQMLTAGERQPPQGVPTGSPVVGITASLREVKRLDRFIEMAAMVVESKPEARFVIAGQGHLEAELREQARSLGIEDAVVFLGQVNDVPALLGHLKVGVLTSESEGLSNSLVEYGLAGVPTVAFDVGGNAEVICEGETGYLVPPGDVAAMAECVIKILANQVLQEAMSEAGRKYCGHTFSPDRVRDMTLEYFRALMESRSGRS